MVQKSPQKSNWFFNAFLMPFWLPKSSNLASKRKRPENPFKIHSNFHWFFHRFLAWFWMAFLFIPALIFNGLSGLGQKGAGPHESLAPVDQIKGPGLCRSLQKECKNQSKNQQNFVSNFNRFWLHFGKLLGSILASFSQPNFIEKRIPKFIDF